MIDNSDKYIYIPCWQSTIRVEIQLKRALISFENLTKKSKSRSDQEIENDELKNFYIKIPNLKIESTSTDNTVRRDDFK